MLYPRSGFYIHSWDAQSKEWILYQLLRCSIIGVDFISTPEIFNPRIGIYIRSRVFNLIWKRWAQRKARKRRRRRGRRKIITPPRWLLNEQLKMLMCIIHWFVCCLFLFPICSLVVLHCHTVWNGNPPTPGNDDANTRNRKDFSNFQHIPFRRVLQLRRAVKMTKKIQNNSGVIELV